MSDGLMLCLRCRGHLAPSGQEPHRFICEKCGQNFLAVMLLIPVDPVRLPALPEVGDAGRGQGAG